MTFEQLARQASSLTEKDYEAVASKVVGEYKELLKRLNDELAALYANLPPKPSDYFNAATKSNRLTNLITQMQKEYLAMARRVGGETERAAIEAIKDSYYRNVYVASWGGEKSVAVRLPDEVVNVSVFGTQEAWKEIKDTATFGVAENYLPKSGTLLSELITKRNPEMLAAIEQAIRAGLITGDSFAKTSRRLRDLMETDAFKASRIVRTESHRNMNTGQYAAMKAAQSQGVDARRMWDATLDDRTRGSHGSADGQLEDENGYFTVAGVKTLGPGLSGVASIDINCRCATVMTVGGEIPALRRARDPVTGRTDIIGWQSYNDWRASLDK